MISPLKTPGREFNAERAFQHLKAQVLFGPRVPGQLAHAKTKEYIISHLQQNNFKVITQDFDQYSPLLKQHLKLSNIIAVNSLDNTAPKVIIGAHWDTRPIADQEDNPELRKNPIPGANDGASGVAVLLELSTALKDVKTSPAVCLVFFDGEDLGFSRSAKDFCYGSKYFAKNLPGECKPVRSAVVIDMIGDADLILKREGFSVQKAPSVVNQIWKIGTTLYPQNFQWQIGDSIYDDHIPLLDSGIPAIDIIDFDYPVWHTMQDDINRCSPQSLKVVGDVLLTWLLKPNH